MTIIKTHELREGEVRPEQLQIYNGLDVCLTHELLSTIKRDHGLIQAPHLIYDFERALQGPALDMMLRGWLVDGFERRKVSDEIREEISRLADILDLYYFEWANTHLKPRPPRDDKPCRYTFPNSNKQLAEFFHGQLKLPEKWTFKKGKRVLSFDRDALEDMGSFYFHVLPIVKVILAIRDRESILDVLDTEIDYDGRWRQSYNIAGTETGRPSSSANAFGTGGNAMNITSDLRRMFIADPGFKIGALDFEQSEARDIGWWIFTLFNDSIYLDACEGGDLHTSTAKLCFDELPWVGNARQDREIADRLYYRHHSYRQVCKILGHGTNLLGTPPTMAKHTAIDQKVIESFQARYFRAYPGIPRFHRWVAEQLQTRQEITSTFGRQRHFFGRPREDATLREAVAFCGQAPTADRTSLVMLRLWRDIPELQLLGEGYDSVVFQYREVDEKKVIEKAIALARVELHHNSRTFVVPIEMKVGWNWSPFASEADVTAGRASRVNPDGLAKWKGEDKRKRTSLMERVL